MHATYEQLRAAQLAIMHHASQSNAVHQHVTTRSLPGTLQRTCAVGRAGSEQAVDEGADVIEPSGRPAAHALRQRPPASCGRYLRGQSQQPLC